MPIIYEMAVVNLMWPYPDTTYTNRCDRRLLDLGLKHNFLSNNKFNETKQNKSLMIF